VSQVGIVLIRILNRNVLLGSIVKILSIKNNVLLANIVQKVPQRSKIALLVPIAQHLIKRIVALLVIIVQKVQWNQSHVLQSHTAWQILQNLLIVPKVCIVQRAQRQRICVRSVPIALTYYLLHSVNRANIVQKVPQRSKIALLDSIAQQQWKNWIVLLVHTVLSIQLMRFFAMLEPILTSLIPHHVHHAKIRIMVNGQRLKNVVLFQEQLQLIVRKLVRKAGLIIQNNHPKAKVLVPVLVMRNVFPVVVKLVLPYLLTHITVVHQVAHGLATVVIQVV